MTASTEALWRRWALHRDRRAFEALIGRFDRYVYDFARRVTGHDADAEDLAQEAFLELSEAAADRPPAVGFKAFLGRRVVLGARMLRRAALTRRRHEHAAARPERVAPAEGRADTEAVLALLDEEDRRAVELRYLHDLSYAEIAHVLGSSEPAARMRVHRALKSLRKRLGPQAGACVAALALFPPPPGFLTNTSRTAALAGGIVVGSTLKKLVFAILLLALVGGGTMLVRARQAAAPARSAQLRGTDEPAPGRAPSADAGAPEVEGTRTPESARSAASDGKARPPIPDGKGSVEGRVEFEDGTPLRGVKLQLWGSPAVIAETDDQGRFHIHGDWVADRDLVIVGANGFYFPLAMVKMKPDEVVRADVVLQAGRTLEGTVVNAATRNPVPGAEVQFERPGAAGAGVHQGSWGMAETDADGRFRFLHVPDGRYSLTVDAPGLESTVREFAVRADQGPLEVLMRPARRLTIRFENLPATLHGAPVTFSFYGPVSVSCRGAIDERGEMRVDAPPAGEYVLATLNGATPLPRIEQKVTVSDGAAPEIVLTLPAGGSVRGRLSPARAARTVHVLPADVRATTDGAGRFEFGFVPAGDQALWVEVGRSRLLVRSIRVPENGAVEADLRLAGATLRGRLVAKGDTWSKGIDLRRPGEKEEVARAGVDSRGDFEIRFVPPGEYDLVAWSEWDLEGEVRRIRVTESDLDLGEITVEASVRVPVLVTAPEGASLAGEHYVDGEHEGERRSVRLALDESGRGGVNLKPGRWKLVVRIDDLAPRTVEVDVPRDKPPLLRIPLVR